MSRALSTLPAALLAAACLAASGCGDSAPRAGATASGPGALAALRAEGGRLLGGGRSAFSAQLGALRGHPVVVNQWASWCGPCRYEFPFFRSLADRYRDRVAFLGVNAQDNRADAQSFLRREPVPYPSYFDLDASVARTFEGGRVWPTTVFYDARGKLARTHPGAYATQARLESDLRRYALGT